MTNGTNHAQAPAARPSKLPTPLIAQWVKYVLGFGISAVIGVAPFLGRYNVPGFTPLLKLLPVSVQDVAIPLSSALMGVVAVLVQWYGTTKATSTWLNSAFLRTLVLCVASVVALFIVHQFTVVRVDLLGGKDYVRFVVGFTRPDNPRCPSTMSDAECIKTITLSESAIDSVWGDKRIRIARTCLILSYLGFTSGFGLLTGLLLLRGQSKP